MRTHLIAASLLAAALGGGTAQAGPSAAIFAFTGNHVPGDGGVELAISYAGGSSSLGDIAFGNYDQSGSNNTGAYLAGLCGSSDGCLGTDLVSHNYFTFDVSTLPGTVTAATLILYNPDATVLPFSGQPVAPGYIAQTASLNYAVYAPPASTAAIDDGTQDTGIYDALASGPVLGSTTVSAADDGMFVDIVLSAQALAGINGGGTFTIGGAVVPEPATWSILSLGMLGVAGLRRRAR